jgi:hypothetical protein
MLNEAIETRGHTGRDGVLKLSLATGLPDAEVALVVRVRQLPAEHKVDANGWPVDFFGRVVGSMPDLERAPQGEPEGRLPLA